MTMSVRHGFLLSVICLVYSATCRPNVFELNEQFTKGNISQLAVTKIDLNGYKRAKQMPSKVLFVGKKKQRPRPFGHYGPKL